MPPPRQAVPYAALLRVSSQAQRERATIETQRAELRRWIEQQGADPDADALWFEDEAVSGDVPLVERGGGAALVAAIEAGRITRAVITYAIDRTGRDIISYFTLVALCEARDLRLISISEGVDTAADGGRFVGAMRAVIADEQKRRMLALTFAGSQRAAREGRWLSHQVPFGFRKTEGGALEIHEAHAAVMREAARLILVERMSARAAFLHLRALGLYPSDHLGTFLRALRNPALAGRAEQFRTRMVSRAGRVVGRVARPAEERVVMRCPPILSEAEFDALQVALGSGASGRSTGRYAAHFWLPVVTCLRCGARYYGEARQYARYYQHRKGAHKGPECTGTIRADPIEDAVWERLRAAVRDVEHWRDEMTAQQATKEPDDRARVAALRKRLATLFRGLAELDAALLRGTITPERYDVASKAAEKERAALAAELQRHERDQERAKEARERRAGMEGTLRDARALAEDATIEEKRALAAAVIERVEITREGGTLAEGGAFVARVVWRG